MEAITLSPAEADRFWAKVRKGQGCWIWTAATRHGYGSFAVGRRPSRRTLFAHRIAYSLARGPIPDGKAIDHICRRPTCVRPDHLRPVTPKQNQENRSPRSSSPSGVRGVRWRADRRKWRAEVKHLGKTICVGHFLTLQEADAAARAARNDLFTHNDHDRV